MPSQKSYPMLPRKQTKCRRQSFTCLHTHFARRIVQIYTWIHTYSHDMKTLAVRGVSDVDYTPVIFNSSTGGWFGILGGTHKKDCVLFMSRLKIVPGLAYKIVIKSWNTHACSSSQEVLLCKDAARGLKEKRERSQSVPLTLPASYSLFLSPPLFPTPRATSRWRMDLRTSFWPLF